MIRGLIHTVKCCLQIDVSNNLLVLTFTLKYIILIMLTFTSVGFQFLTFNCNRVCLQSGVSTFREGSEYFFHHCSEHIPPAAKSDTTRIKINPCSAYEIQWSCYVIPLMWLSHTEVFFCFFSLWTVLRSGQISFSVHTA